METNPPQNTTYRPPWAITFKYLLLILTPIPALTILTWVYAWRDEWSNIEGLGALAIPPAIVFALIVIFGGTSWNYLMFTNVSKYLANYIDSPNNRKFTSIKISTLLLSASHLVVMSLIIWLWLFFIIDEHKEVDRIEKASQQKISDMYTLYYFKKGNPHLYRTQPQSTPTQTPTQ
jgi:hypothetical protein